MANGVITWRNVVGPSLADASRPMELARQSFDGAFSGLDKMLKERQELAHQQILRQDQQKLLGVQEMLAGAATPEQLAAIQPQVNAIRGELRPETRGQLVGAEHKALSDLYDLPPSAMPMIW